MQNYIRKTAKGSIAISVALLIVALFLFFKPEASFSFILIAFGAILVIHGIFHLISYFSIKNEYRLFSYELVQAIISIILGFVFILNTEFIGTFVPVIVSIWIILESVIRFQIAFNLRDVPNSYWILMLILSIMTFGLGLVVLLNPFASLMAVTTVCGAILFLTEIINLFESIAILLKIKDE